MNDQVKNFELETEGTITSELEGKYLTFFADSQLFGIPIAHVVQIINVQEITEIPEFPSYAKGIVNLRGNIIPVIDIRLRLGKLEAPYDEKTCIIVTNIHGHDIGYIVDMVNEVTDIEDELISPPPKVSKERTSVFLTGIGKKNGKVTLLLDPEKLVDEEDIEAVVQIAGE